MASPRSPSLRSSSASWANRRDPGSLSRRRRSSSMRGFSATRLQDDTGRHATMMPHWPQSAPAHETRVGALLLQDGDRSLLLEGIEGRVEAVGLHSDDDQATRIETGGVHDL